MNVQTIPLQEDERINELLRILRENNMDTGFLATILDHVREMEQQLGRAVSEVYFMRHELSNMQYEKDHPAAGMLRRSGEKMDRAISTAREGLETLKTAIITGCKNALAAFREKGIKALNNLSEFFHLKDGFRAISNSAEDGVKAADVSIAHIETAAREYHEVGQHLRNMGRAMAGKEAVGEAKPVGKVAKALEAPIKLQRACCVGIHAKAENAINALERLEQAAVKPAIPAFGTETEEMERSSVTPQSESMTTTAQESSVRPQTSPETLRQQAETEVPETDEDETMEQSDGFCMSM